MNREGVVAGWYGCCHVTTLTLPAQTEKGGGWRRVATGEKRVDVGTGSGEEAKEKADGTRRHPAEEKR